MPGGKSKEGSNKSDKESQIKDVLVIQNQLNIMNLEGKEGWHPWRRKITGLFKLLKDKVTYDPLAVGSIDGTDTEPHDMGIVRALNNEYTPNMTLSSKPECTIFVARLHPKVTEEELESLFKEYGSIKRCNVIRDLVTGHSKQYGFIEFDKESQAERACRKGHKALLRGLEILVDREFGRAMKGWKPRRLGGGFGGRKESGQLRFGCRDHPWRPPIVPQRGKFS